MKTTSFSVVPLFLAGLASAQVASTNVGTPTTTGSSSGSIATVQVGESGLQFVPDSLTAEPGDVIAFVIHTTHNVARSSFDSPCQPIGGSDNIWTGNPDDGTVFSVTVNDTNPVWLYCATPGHCEGGMAMVINPPDGDDTLSAYVSAASSVSDSSAPTEIAGGVFGTPTASGDVSSTTSESSSGMTSPTSASESMMTSSGGGSATSSSASTTSSPNAARSMMADVMMVGGVVLGGAALVL